MIRHADHAQEQLDASFHVIKTLGEGAFGMVTLLSHKPSGRLFAMKKMSKRGLIRLSEAEKSKADKMDATLKADVMRERQSLIDCSNCSFITTMYFAFQTLEDVFMVMDFAPGGGLLSCWVAGLLGCWVAGLLGCRVAELPSC